MGPGMAQSYAMGGIEVKLCDNSAAALQNAKVMLHTNLETFVEENLLTSQEAKNILEHITYFTNLPEAVDGVQLVQEAVSEKPDVKRAVFTKLDELLPEDAIIVSNTSSLNPFILVPEKAFTEFYHGALVCSSTDHSFGRSCQG